MVHCPCAERKAGEVWAWARVDVLYVLKSTHTVQPRTMEKNRRENDSLLILSAG
jgi:hypothetical protein